MVGLAAMYYGMLGCNTEIAPVWIERVEFDDDNVEHVTRHGVTIADVEGVFAARPTIRRNKGGRTADY